ncbi:MAG: hypothetical protein P1V36_12535, partial [Planctomycetota bacterium]|nr:hypothetical protein [Planctomycetota bacterium]
MQCGDDTRTPAEHDDLWQLEIDLDARDHMGRDRDGAGRLPPITRNHANTFDHPPDDVPWLERHAKLGGLSRLESPDVGVD